jgi:DNA recombination protein Rad52
MFTTQQNKHLKAKLEPSHVSKRDKSGTKLSYIEGWFAIAEANRIFGFDGWSRHTVSMTNTDTGTMTTKTGKELKTAAYNACVEITVYAEDRVITRQGTGSGSGMGLTAGEAHEGAVKEAETDAMKRAFMTFGNPFGLALYDKTQANVGENWHGPLNKSALHKAATKFSTQLQACLTSEDVNMLVKDNEGMLGQMEIDMPVSYLGNGADIRGAQAAIADKLDSLNAVTG